MMGWYDYIGERPGVSPCVQVELRDNSVDSLRILSSRYSDYLESIVGGSSCRTEGQNCEQKNEMFKAHHLGIE